MLPSFVSTFDDNFPFASANMRQARNTPEEQRRFLSDILTAAIAIAEEALPLVDNEEKTLPDREDPQARRQ